MKNCLSFIAIVLFAASQASAQTSYYWVKFTDKNNNGYTVNTPQQFLTQRAIDRRTRANIAIDESDLPITQTYINAIAPYTENIVHRLKWINTVVIAVTDSTFNPDDIKQFSFVDSLNKIEFPPSRSAKQKFEDPYPVIDQHYVYPNPYGMAYRQANMLNADLLHQSGHKGKDIIIAVMDNGFYNVNNIKGFDSIRTQILATWDFVHNDGNVYDGGGHGTNVLSCIGGHVKDRYLGTAPSASFFLLQSEDDGAEWVMEEYNWAAAAEWADSAGADIFSTSLGYTDFDDDIGSHTYADLTGDKTVITHASNQAFEKGILVINSAGNEGANSWHYVSAPADGINVMAVGAVDSAEIIAGFSSRGPSFDNRIKPDVCAQGVRSAVITSGGDLGYSGGTSFSCPVLAGAAASLWSAFPQKTATEIYTAIMATCDRKETPDNEYGYGIPNFYMAFLMLRSDSNTNIFAPDYNLAVFPNPSTNVLYIALSHAASRDYSFELYDMLGNKVLNQDKHIYIREDNEYGIFKLPGYENLAAGKYVLIFDGDRKHPLHLIKGAQ